jgi:hypothetical protein
MLTSGHQGSGLAEETDNRNVSRHEMGGSSEGSCAVALEKKMRTHFEPHGDVLFVDLCEALPTDRIDVVDVGEQAGFPGLIQARVNREKQIVYGITIQNYTAFRRKLLWSYRMASVHHALVLLLMGLITGFRMDHNSTARAW